MVSTYERNKTKVFKHYGNQCETCGNSDTSNLGIFFSLGNGVEYKKKRGITGTSAFYAWVVKHDYPEIEGINVLCKKCLTKALAKSKTKKNRTEEQLERLRKGQRKRREKESEAYRKILDAGPEAIAKWIDSKTGDA